MAIYQMILPQTPVGALRLLAEDHYIIRLDFDNSSDTALRRFLQRNFGSEVISHGTSPVLQQAKNQLEEYFAGARQTFDLPLKLYGTDFYKSVWQALADIPYGETETYGQLARRVGCPKGSRAVGQANHNNPIAIILPCHRVVGSGGRLTGFGGGLPRKETLLALEAQHRTAK